MLCIMTPLYVCITDDEDMWASDMKYSPDGSILVIVGPLGKGYQLYLYCIVLYYIVLY